MFQIWNSSLKIGILGQPDNLNNNGGQNGSHMGVYHAEVKGGGKQRQGFEIKRNHRTEAEADKEKITAQTVDVEEVWEF